MKTLLLIRLYFELIMSARHYEDCEHAKLYVQYRPKTPPKLIKTVIDYVNKMSGGNLNMAVDVGCGSGQSTLCLAESFANVIGVDISEVQIKEANNYSKLKNVKYMVSPAEKLPFTDNSVQLVTAGTACHWFDIPSFFTECDRVLAPGGVLALYAHYYPRPIWGDVSEELFQLFCNIVDVELQTYWPKEIDMIRNCYATIEHPYPDVHRIKNIFMDQTHTVAEFVGFIRSWSSYQKYKNEKGDDAAEKLMTTFTDKFMKLLDVSTTPEETKLIIRHNYHVLFGSKPK